MACNVKSIYIFGLFLSWNCKNLVGSVRPGKPLGLFDCTQPVWVWCPWALDVGAGAIKPVLWPCARNVVFFFQASYMSQI